MGHIRLLAEEVYRKIAAGEVIERPLSVVKELVENAIDAGARDIRVSVAGGGKERVRVEDDGAGFAAAEIELAFERHCTSKLEGLDDFDSLRTLGFRGEALPSIREVAEVELWSSDRDDGRGVRVLFADGRLSERAEVPWPRGTAIEVRRLFHSLPVRRKFMRGDASELAQVVAWLEQAALSRPDIAFSLDSGRRSLFAYPRARDPGERIYQVFGRDFLAGLIPLDYADGECRLSGYVSRPGAGEAARNRQFFFVNRRPVRERTLLAALNQACAEHLEKSRHPGAVLFLEVSPADIDVNIHPMKLEIRFRDSRRIFSLLHHGIRAAFRGAATTPGGPALAGAAPPPEKPEPEAAGGETGGAPRSLFDAAGAPGAAEDDFDLLGQYARSYIVAERRGSLLLVDQHNAHERILFERLRTGRPESAPVLFPLLLDLSPAEQRRLDGDKLAFLAHTGFDVDRLDDSTLQVRAFPALLDERRVRDAILALLQPPEEEAPGPDGWLATVACKAAVKANQRLHPDQMRALLRGLFRLENPRFCPHRRPISVELGLDWIEKQMKRR